MNVVILLRERAIGGTLEGPQPVGAYFSSDVAKQAAQNDAHLGPQELSEGGEVLGRLAWVTLPWGGEAAIADLGAAHGGVGIEYTIYELEVQS